MNYYNISKSNDFFYGNTKKLKLRINAWHKYGTNSFSYDQFLQQHINKRVESYLDFGCGSAVHSIPLLKNVTKKAVFADCSADILKSVYSSLKNIRYDSNLEIGFACQDLLNSNFLDNEFELVTVMHVLHHIDDINRALYELKRITRGELVIVTFDKDHMDELESIHYQILEKLNFPDYMMDHNRYLAFSGNNAEEIIGLVFNSYNRILYTNDMIIPDAEAIMQYYESSMQYRMANFNDIPVGDKRWKDLHNQVYVQVYELVKRRGFMSIDGKLSLYKIPVSA